MPLAVQDELWRAARVKRIANAVTSRDPDLNLRELRACADDHHSRGFRATDFRAIHEACDRL